MSDEAREASGRTYHREFCPVERWLVDESFGAPEEGMELMARPEAGARAGQKARFNGQKWKVIS